MKSIRRILLLVALIVPLPGCGGGRDPAEDSPEGVMEATTHLYENAPGDHYPHAPVTQPD
jgi:hypothetical protein